MNTLTLVNLYLTLYVINEDGKFSTGYAGPDPPRQFQYLAMDHIHRGSFNNTDCVRELINCWEVVKPDIICSKYLVFESVCGLMKKDCSERHGYLQHYDGPLFESFCHSEAYEQLT